MKTPLSVICFVLSMSAIVSAADPQYLAEDLDVYRKSLFVQDAGVQRATISVLAHYDEGADLLADFVKRNPKNRNAVLALETLKKFSDRPEYRFFLVDLYKSDDAELSPELRRTVLGQLFDLDPKEYAAPLVKTITEHLAGQDTHISFSDKSFDQIQVLSPHVDKKDLYPLVPHLIRFLDAFFSQVRPRAHKCLVMITGENYPLPTGGGRRKAGDAAEKYRELYYTKLLPQIRKAEAEE